MKDTLKMMIGLALTVISMQSFSDVWYVDDATGSDSNDGSATAPFKTIQRALDLGADILKDGEIVVAAGVYKLAGSPIHGNLYCKLRGATGEPLDTVIDAENLSECARFAGHDNKKPFVVSGFTFKNGNNPTKEESTYCALSIVKNVVVSNCVVTSCGSDQASLPPVFLSDAKMVCCVISNCVSKGNGTAVRLSKDGIFEKGLVTDCTAPGGAHGPFFAYNGGVVRDSVISNNVSRLNTGVYGLPQEVSGCVFLNNRVTMDASRDGGTIIIASTGATTVPDLCVISNCVISGTVLDYPGVVGCSGINITDVSSLVVGCVISNNVSRRYTGMYVRLTDSAKSIDIVDCVVADNEAKYGSGGGAYFGNGVKVTDCVFAENRASDLGGGVYGLGFIMDGCTISNNSANCGGGVCVVTNGVAVAVVSNSMFQCNSSKVDGGALSIGYKYKADCEYTNGCAFVYSSVFERNCAEGGRDGYPGGGAVSILQEGKSSVLIEGCTFKSNSTLKYGGAISYRGVASESGDESINIRSSLFVGNSSSKNGGAVYMISAKTANIDNCTFAENNSAEQNGGGDTYIRWSGVKIRNCIYAQNKFDSYAVYKTAVYNSCLNGDRLPSVVLADNGNFAADLKFVDMDNGDYSLQQTSPCVNAGLVLDWMTSKSSDVAGSRRISSSLPDLGAYEFYFPWGFKFSIR